MTEDRIRRAFDLLDRPVVPDAGFRDELFERLREEAGRRPRRLPRPSVVPGPSSTVRRTFVIAATLGLTIAVLAAILWPLRNIGDGTASATVGPFGPMPAFRASIEIVAPSSGGDSGSDAGAGTSQITLSYAEPDAWRSELVSGNAPGMIPPEPGSFGVWDGQAVFVYDARDNTYGKARVTPPFDTFSPLNLLSWEGAGSSTWPENCPNPTEVGREILAGRSAIHLACPPDGPVGGPVDLWIDTDTGLVLKIVMGPSPTGGLPVRGPFGIAPGGSLEVTKIEYDPTFGPDEVTWAPPDGAVSAKDAPPAPPTNLTIGQPVPTWTLPSLGGGQVDLPSLRGEPTIVYVWASWCEICAGSNDTTGPGDPLDAFDRAFVEHASAVALVSVAYRDDHRAVATLVDAGGYTVPVALDDDGVVPKMWGSEGIPLLLVMDADGTFAGAYLGDLQGTDVRAIVDAVVAGNPLPDIGGTTVEQLPG